MVARAPEKIEATVLLSRETSSGDVDIQFRAEA